MKNFILGLSGVTICILSVNNHYLRLENIRLQKSIIKYKQLL